MEEHLKACVLANIVNLNCTFQSEWIRHSSFW